jgi:hypothetical protein
MLADARPQARKNRRRIRWNMLRAHGATNKSHHVCARRRDGEAAGTVLGRERRRCLQIVFRSRMVLLGQAPRTCSHFPCQEGPPLNHGGNAQDRLDTSHG